MEESLNKVSSVSKKVKKESLRLTTSGERKCLLLWGRQRKRSRRGRRSHKRVGRRGENMDLDLMDNPLDNGWMESITDLGGKGHL